MYLSESDALLAVAFAPALILSDASSISRAMGALDILHQII
jgi:hypothetical protein